MEILWLLVGVLIGGITVWLIMRFRNELNLQKAGTSLELEASRTASLREELNGLKESLRKERAEVLELNNQLSASDANYRNLQEKLHDQKDELANLQKRFSVEFKNLANDIFEEKSKKFTDQNKVNLNELLNPLKERIIEFERKVENNSKTNLEQSVALREQLKGLKELNQQLSSEAQNLTKALKGDNKTQGTWGEFILESILEKSGLEKDREYFVQESVVTDEGKRFQPDVVVKLPDNKSIVIDSKVTLTAYERYISADDINESYLKAHILSMRNHLNGLSEKNYHQLYGIKSLDFVLMFIPIEPAFSLAVQKDFTLFNNAYDKNIVIVSPSTLIATLRTISNIWKNEYQHRNAYEIARQGGNLYDKFVLFTEDLKKVGVSLESTQRVYGEAMKKLSEGKGNLVNKVQAIKKLGAKTSKSIDNKLIQKDESSEID
ncbi:MAG: DNA recombination protein RmuC [Bacteroidota bacterium]